MATLEQLLWNSPSTRNAVGENPNESQGQLPSPADVAYAVAEMAPVTGEALAAKDTYENLTRGAYRDAALSALGAIPLVGSTVGRAVKKGIWRTAYFSGGRPWSTQKSGLPRRKTLHSGALSTMHTANTRTS